MALNYIYHVSWAAWGVDGMNAVVVAPDEKIAIVMLDLDSEHKCIKATWVGVALLGVPATILAKESL